MLNMNRDQGFRILGMRNEELGMPLTRKLILIPNSYFLIKHSLASSSRSLFPLLLALCYLLFVSCNLFNAPLDPDYFDKIDEEIAYANAPLANVKIGSIPGSVNTIIGSLGRVKQGYSFNVAFTANPEWAFTGWEAVLTEDFSAYLHADRQGQISFLNKIHPFIIIEDKQDDSLNLTGDAVITIKSGAAITIVPRCAERPDVYSSNLPGNFTDRKVINYPINIWFNRELHPNCVNFDNFYITAETNWGMGGRILEGDDITKYFNAPVVNGRRVFISTNIPENNTEFYNLNLNVRVNLGAIYDRYEVRNTGQPDKYRELGYDISNIKYTTEPLTAGMEAAAGRHNKLISGSSIIPAGPLPDEESYYVQEENGERLVYLMLDADALEQSINREYAELFNIRVTEKREGETYPSEYPYAEYGVMPDDPVLISKYTAKHPGRKPYIVRHILRTQTDGTIQIALQPVDTLGNYENFDKAQKVRVILDTTSTGLLENLAAVYNQLTETLTVSWAKPGNIAGILISQGIMGGQLEPLPTLAPGATSYIFNGISKDHNYIFSFRTYDTLNNYSLPQFLELNHAEKPLIISQPQGGNNSSSVLILKVDAAVNDGGSLSYQWFSNTTNSNIGGTPVQGATGISYEPPTLTDGTFYYYAVVTNTNDRVIGVKTASTASDAVAVIVNDTMLTVTFNAGGGMPAPQSPVSVPRGSKLNKPEHMTKGFEMFNGWYKDALYSEGWNFEADTVNNNTTLYAKWQPLLDWLKEQSNGETENDPIYLSLNFQVNEGNWNYLFMLIEEADKFIDLDLSACTRLGYSENIGSGVLFSNGDFFIDVHGTGSKKIVSMILPDAATSLKHFNNFTNNLISLTGRAITRILEFTFQNNTSLASVDFPAVTIIDRNAFSGCTSLSSVSFPLAASIDSLAFSGCTSLNSVSFPLSTSIGDEAFSGCTSLSRVNFPLAVSIGERAFNGCTDLSTMNFPLAANINQSAFSGCTSLSSVNFPLAASIGDKTFTGCTSLTSISFPASVTINFSTSFSNCPMLSEFIITGYGYLSTAQNGMALLRYGTELIAFPSASGSVSLDNRINSVGPSTFQENTNLTGITLPEGLTEIASSAFYGCTSLAEIILPDGLIEITSFAFYGCIGLTEITLPAGFSSIGSNAFNGCSNLEQVTCLAETPPLAIGSGTLNLFANTHSNLQILVPALSVDEYKAATGWSQYADKIFAITP